MNVQLLLETVSISILLVGLAAFLGKVLIKQLLSRDIEKFKADLNILAFEHQIRFSRLHDKQASVIAEIYTKLIDAFFAIHNYIKPFVPVGDLPENEREQQAIRAINDFINYYRKHAIYFNEDLCNKIDSFIEQNKNILVNFQFRNRSDKSVSQTWMDIYDKFEKDVQNLKKNLETSFRNMIGVK